MNNKPKFWVSRGGSLMCDRNISGLVQVLDNPDHIRWYGGEFFICETIGPTAGKIIAEALGGEFLKEAPKT